MVDDSLRDRVLAMADATLLGDNRELALAVAAMVQQHEREACAQIVETHSIGRRDAIAAAIRARGDTL